jgi:hypothetical protein
VSGDGSAAVAALGGEEQLRLIGFRIGDNDIHLVGDRTTDAPSSVRLAPRLVGPVGREVVALRAGAAPLAVSLYWGPELLPVETVEPTDDYPLPCDLLLPSGGRVRALVLGDLRLRLARLLRADAPGVTADAEPGEVVIGWTPAVPPGSSLRQPPIDWLYPIAPEYLQLTGLDADGELHWTEVFFEQRQPQRMRSANAVGPFRAAVLLRPGVVAAVAPRQVTWLRAGRDNLVELAPPSPLPDGFDPVAATVCRPTRELLVVSSDGRLVKLTEPRDERSPPARG